MTNNVIKYLSALVVGLFLVIATSYAFFTASVSGNNNASTSVITTGIMEVNYVDGNLVGTTSKMMPGDYVTKEFSVVNTGNMETSYSIYLNDVVNTFNTKSDLVYELISEEGRNVVQTTCPSLNESIASDILIGAGETHNYTLKITFLNIDRNQDDNKGKGFNARVDLVEEENVTKYIADQIIDFEKVNIGDLMYDGVDNLGEYGTNDNNLRYVGATPNNYVYYNCSTTNPSEMNDTTCEKWRIIGVFNNIEDENGNTASRVKLIKATKLSDGAWDIIEGDSTGGQGINQWGESTYEDGSTYEGADLMRELNTDYLGNITVGTDGRWIGCYSGNCKAITMPSKLLNNSSVDMIQDVKWYLGASNNLINVKNVYEDERSNKNGKSCDDSTTCNDTVVRTSTWVGKVGILSVSDYGYAPGNSSKLINDGCSLFALNGNSCNKTHSWIYNGAELTMNAYINNNRSSQIYVVASWNGAVTGYIAASPWMTLRPTLFLKSNVRIVGGSGTIDMPYKIAM